MTLDLQIAAKAFTNMVVHLGKRRGVTDLPLAYVVHCTLKEPNDAYIENETEDPPLFGQSGSPYFSIDDKLIAWGPILHHDLTHRQLAASLETLESNGPFESSFLTNMVIVYNGLHSCWGKSGWWSHVKKFSKSKNGCQVYQTLHALLLGGQQVASTGSAIIPKLQSFRYEGNHKSFNFDKYVNLHIEHHNQHADLQEYGVAPLAESLKILWFQDGIKCNSLDAVKAFVNANHSNFTDFHSIKDAYVEFKRTLGPTSDPKTRQVASVSLGGCGGGSCLCQSGHGQGHHTNDNCQKGLFPQAEINKQTYIQLKVYSNEEYKKLTTAEMQKLWQLRNVKCW
jgi:hypothetical protein